MQRCLAFFFALFLTTLSVASACSASTSDRISFTLEPARGGRDIQATFRDYAWRDGDSRWSSSFAPVELVGLDVAAFQAAGSRPLHFAVVRDAGRLDCRGEGGGSRAQGACTFKPDAGFAALLRSRAIGPASPDKSFAMMAVDVRRPLIDAIAAARYPTPSIDDLIAATAVGVTGTYIQDLARVGYRPSSIDNLVEFRALNITPDFIAGFARAGYPNMAPDHLVQVRAMNITPEFVAGFERIGYRNLDVDALVQFKAMNITPEFVAGFQRIGYASLPVDKLVELKALNITPELVRAVERRRGEMPSIEQLAVLQSLNERR